MRKQTNLWKTADGRKVSICDMTDSHLNNTVACLERKILEYHYREIAYASTLLVAMTGEIACDTLESQIMAMEEDGPEYPDIYYCMLEDQRRRDFINGSTKR